MVNRGYRVHRFRPPVVHNIRQHARKVSVKSSQGRVRSGLEVLRRQGLIWASIPRVFTAGRRIIKYIVPHSTVLPFWGDTPEIACISDA